MDSYTHLYVEDLRPIAEKLAEQWKAAVALRAAEKCAEDAVKALGSVSTLSTQPAELLV
jgi:hypothetical protein